MTDLTVYRKKLDRLLGKRANLQDQIAAEQAALEKATALEQSILTGQKLVQDVAEAIQQRVHRRIGDVVTRCLRAVFDQDAYEFRIKFSQKRGKTEAELLFVRDGLEVDPLSAAGGGAVDVAAYALRVACLMLSRNRRLLVLDEPFKHLSRDYRPAVRQLILSLAGEMEIQHVMVTHDPALAVGKVVELE